MTDLQVICDGRQKPIEDAGGRLWIDNDQITAAAWNRKHTIP